MTIKRFKEMTTEEIVELYRQRQLAIELFRFRCNEDERCFAELTKVTSDIEEYLVNERDVDWEELEVIENHARNIVADLNELL